MGGRRATEAKKGKLDGPLRTAEYNGQLWAAPFTTNTQLLWYRKDKVKELPKNYTWDDLIDIAAENGSSIQVQAARYEGYTVWINSLIASAGGSLVDQNGDVHVDDTAERAAEIIKRVADEAAPEGMSNNKEDQARLGFESGSSDFEVNYTFVWASAGELGGDFQKNMGYARYPRVDKDKPSKVTWAGSTWASARTRSTPTSPSRPRSAWRSRRTRSPPPNWAAWRRPPSRSTTTQGQEGVPVRRPDAPVARRGRPAAGEPRVLGHLAGDPEDVPSA